MSELLERLRAALAERYEIGEQIGEGGMAVVYKARDLRSRAEVAIKVLRENISTALAAERFRQEIDFATRLHHENILPALNSGETEGVFWYTMPLVDTESLRDRLREDPQRPFDETLRVAREVAAALDYAHEQGVVHRDIKPHNILFDPEGRALVADFGIARAIERAGGEKLTKSGVRLGTPAYMSPEQGAGSERLDGRSDVYALGCVVFEMLAGQPPYLGRDDRVVIAQHISAAIPAVTVHRRKTPEPMAAAITRALAKDPVDRFQTAGELTAALASPKIRRPRGQIVRALARKAAGAAGVLALTALGVWWFLLRQSTVLDPNRVVVFPLTERGVAAGTGFDVAIIIETALAHVDPLKWIDGWQRLSKEQRADPDLITQEDGRRIANGRRARYFTTGVVQARGDSTVVVLWLHDAVGDSTIAMATVGGVTRTTPLHVQSIEAVKGLLPRLVDPARAIDLDPLQRRSPDAITFFLLGERAYREAQFESAYDLYARALEADSALVFAAVQGAQAASWLYKVGEAGELAAYATRNDSLLTPRYATLARGLEARMVGTADSALVLLEAALELDPQWAEAYQALGEVYYHLLPDRAPLDSLAEDAFRKAFDQDSSFAPPLVHLVEFSIRGGRDAEARELIDRYGRFEPDGQFVEVLKIALDCAADRESVDWSSVAADGPLQSLNAARVLSVGASNLGCAKDAFAAVLGSPVASDSERWSALIGLQAAHLAAGEQVAAIAVVDSAINDGTPQAMLALLAGAAHLRDLDSAAAAAEAMLVGVMEEGYLSLPSDWLWLVAERHARNADTPLVFQAHEEMKRRFEQLERLDAGMFGAGLQAYLFLARADTARAIETLEAISPSPASRGIAWRLAEPLPGPTLLLAKLLLATDRAADALRVASIFDHPGPIAFLPYIPASLVIRYEAAMAMDRFDLAERYRTRLGSLSRTDLIGELDAG